MAGDDNLLDDVMSSKDEDMLQKLAAADDFEELAGDGVAQPYAKGVFATEEEKVME